METLFEGLIERGQVELRARYRCYLDPQAVALLDAEVALTRSKNFIGALIQMLKHGDRLRRRDSNLDVVRSRLLRESSTGVRAGSAADFRVGFAERGE